MRNVCCNYCGMPAKRVTALSNAANRPHTCPSQESCDWKDVDLYLIEVQACFVSDNGHTCIGKMSYHQVSQAVQNLMCILIMMVAHCAAWKEILRDSVTTV